MRLTLSSRRCQRLVRVGGASALMIAGLAAVRIVAYGQQQRSLSDSCSLAIPRPVNSFSEGPRPAALARVRAENAILAIDQSPISLSRKIVIEHELEVVESRPLHLN